MPATITCPHCKVTLKPKTPVPAGARIKCPKCQTAFVVPGGGAAPAAAAPKQGPKSAVAKPAAPKPKPAPPPEEEEEVAEAEAADGADDEAAAEEGEAPVKAKKKIPLWVWLASAGVALVLLCGCCGLPSILYVSGVTTFGLGSLTGGNISMDTYKKLKKGMTEDQIKAVMGGAPSLQQEAGAMHAETWKGSGDDFITVEFRKDGKAIAGGYQFTNGPAKMSGGGLLP